MRWQQDKQTDHVTQQYTNNVTTEQEDFTEMLLNVLADPQVRITGLRTDYLQFSMGQCQEKLMEKQINTNYCSWHWLGQRHENRAKATHEWKENQIENWGTQTGLETRDKNCILQHTVIDLEQKGKYEATLLHCAIKSEPGFARFQL